MGYPPKCAVESGYEIIVTGAEILLDHKRYLEHDCMVELTQIQSGKLLDLLKTVYQSISVDEELSGCFGNVQVVLKELIDGIESFLVERIDGILLEDLIEVHFAESSGQLINKAADTEVIVVNYHLVVLKDLTYFDSHHCFLIALSQLAEVTGNRAYADNGLEEEFGVESGLDLGGNSGYFLAVCTQRQFLDEHYIGLADAENEVLLAVGEEILHNLNGAYLNLLLLANEENSTGSMNVNVQLLGTDIQVGQQGVIGDDILDKGGLIVLFLIVSLGFAECDGCQHADAAGLLVGALYKNGVIIVGIPASKEFEGACIADYGLLLCIGDDRCGATQMGTYHGQLIASYYITFRINYTDNSIGSLLHLDNDALKNSS